MFTYQIKNPAEAFINIEIEQGAFAGKTLKSTELQPCMDMTCPCGNIYFADDTENVFALDVSTSHILKYTDKDTLDGSKDATLKAFEDEITPAQWKELNTFYRDLKGMASEMAETGKIEAQFANYKRVLQESQMVSYYEILPWSYDLHLEIDGTKYWMSDFYCVQPSCQCTSVMLLFSLSYDEQPNLELWFDYAKQEVSMGQLDDKTLPVTKIIREIKYTQADRFRKTLSNRHKRMNDFFVDFLKRNNITPSMKSPVIAGDNLGRNDLCGCGSGKKYKKCCGV
ncbi:SEC-C metal-binding domain-containing protein [Emticicia sp. 21SJ11W-3]|uniref:SEC-C metal-binding domain-containing protein n=1 Tax=Emticicia sp. 21SJ11W-3 TaxID=2916755 RepID=UPI00209FD83D|nr:SEC-C metal-binding domain-containing protein [Emticicia sp. 21SJ11W-3]UTA69875.1 SEC-C domain-containing protein [Emticicia sp. 21SJ11W-3]